MYVFVCLCVCVCVCVFVSVCISSAYSFWSLSLSSADFLPSAGLIIMVSHTCAVIIFTDQAKISVAGSLFTKADTDYGRVGDFMLATANRSARL